MQKLGHALEIGSVIVIGQRILNGFAQGLILVDMAQSFSDSSINRSRSSGKVAASTSLCQLHVAASAAARKLCSSSRR